jgi:hypothetical protein
MKVRDLLEIPFSMAVVEKFLKKVCERVFCANIP